MKKRIISLILALTLCVGMLPAPAWAEEPTDPTQAVEVVGAANPSEETDPTTEPTEEETEPTEEETEPTEAPKAAEVPAEETAAPGEDEAVTAVQAMIDALPDVEDMSESYLDALEAAYSAFDALSESQQAQITGVEKLEALFGWVNSQVSTLAAEETISGEVTWNNRTFNTPVKLTGDTTLTLVGDNKIECDQPLDLNGKNLTIQGTGTLEVVGDGRSDTWMCNGAIFDSTYNGYTKGGTLTLAGGTVKASGGKYNAISVRSVELRGGKLEAYGGSNAGIVCSYLYTYGGSLYATGSDCGIEMRTRNAGNPGNLAILASDEKDALMAEMDAGDIGDIKDNAKKKTYYIGEVTGPMLSVKAQKGYLYEGTADQTATFSYSAKNLDGCMFGVAWTGAHPGLTAVFSENDDQTIIVTTKDIVKQGTYELKLTAANAESAKTLATKTFTVTVLGGPITVTAQPQDASVSCKGGDLDAWQGDKKIQVTAKLAAGLTGDITYQWKLEDGTVLVGFNQPTLSLKNLYSDNKLPPVADQPWLSSAKVYCTLTYGRHSVNTNAVTLTVNTCEHGKANHDGTCQQCGEPCSSETLLVSERGTYHAVDTSQTGTAEVGSFLTGGGTVYLTKDVLTRDINAGNNEAGSEDVTLDLQEHTVKSLQMGNFPYGTFTVKNGTLGEIGTVASGKLILENIHYKDTFISALFDLTVKGENTRFELPVVFHGTTHLRGGHFEQGLDSNCVERALELLDDGFAFQNDQGIVDASNPENLKGEIQVVAHTCKYVSGKCECGRSCDHVDKVNADGYCTNCGTLVYPFAIGEKLYTGLEAALTAAQDGDTVTLRGDYDMQGATVEIKKSITLELNGHTLSGWPYAPILIILAQDVTIQNGTVKNTDTSKSSPAVEVGSLSITGATLTVKDATFEGSESHGTLRNYGLSIFAGNTAQAENGTFTGGIYVSGSLTLSGGKADRICVETGVTYASLLAKGYAYQAKGQLVKRENMADGIAVEVVKCGHPDGLTDTVACAYCGLTCPHSTVSDETGLCQECGSQVYEANVTTADGSVTGYRTLEEALGNGRNATVKLLADCKGEDTFHVTVPLTLDLNGKRMEGPSGLLVKKGPTTILDSSPAKTGTIAGTSNWEFSGKGLSVYKDANVTLTILGGHIEGKTDGLRLVGQNTLILKGGSFSSIHFVEGAAATLRDSLAPGYAYYKDADNTLYDPGDRQEATVRLHVGAHPEHTLDSSGHCSCGYTAAAMLATEAGKQYFANFSVALEVAKAASGSTLTLLRDVALTGENNLYIASGTFTIDWNGHTLSGEMSSDLLLITDAAKVTLTDSVGTGGVRNVGGAAIGAYVRSQGSLTIRGGVYSPQLWKGQRAYGSIQISGGEFRNPTDSGRYGALYCDSGALADLLAPGCTFAYEEDDTLFHVYGARKPEDYRTVYVVAHTHENWTDGVCDCGYTCPHAEVDEEGECTLCGKRFYVRGTYADGTTHYYGTISDALADSAVTQATILRALTEECESWNGGDRSVTLDLNGWNLVVESIQGGHLILRDSSGIGSILAVKEIQKDGQVSVESGRLAPQGELSVYGKLTVSGGKVDSLTAMEGCTVSLTGGDVDSLTAMEGSTVSLSGGSFDKIVGSGVTLKELLAEDCYYAELGGETPKDYADTDTVLEQVSVKLCDHTSVRENKGTYFSTYTCNCGRVTYLLTVTVGENDKKYFGDYNTGFAYAAKNDGVVRFLKNGVNGTIEVNAQGMVTIDMENRSYTAYDRSLVIKSGSTVKLVGQGSVMSTPEAGSGSGSSSGTLEYSEFIPVTVESGGTFVLPANNLNGEPNMAKPTRLTVLSGGTAELQGGSTQWTDVYGTLKISGGSHSYIHQYEKGQLNITGGQIQLLQIYGDLPQNALSGGSYVTISVMEFKPGESQKFRDVTFADFQKMLVSGKVFQKKQDQSYPNEAEKTPNYGTFNYVKELNNVNVTAAPFTGVQVVCQLGADTYEEGVSTQYNVGETDSSGNVVFRLGVNIQSQEAQPGVTVQWYELGAEDSRTPAGTGLTCPLDCKLPVGTHRFLAVVNCSGYVLESQPFAVTVTPRVVNITGGFTAQDRDYEPDNPSVQIIQGEVTFDKKAEEDDLSAQVSGGTIATPDAGQNRTVAYSVTLTGEDKDNYTLGSVPKLTVTIRPIAQTLTFAETAVTKTYGDSPFVNALDHSTGDGRITYTSSDPAVATVGTEGTVTIRGAGEARITATAAATQNYVETAASFDLTVAKATGTVRNRNYSLGYLYGDDIPTPERKYFEASSTGAFRYSWSPAAPKNAGNYQLTVTVDEDGNYTSATLVLNVLVEKDVWVRPTLVKAENETVDGKKDGKVTYTDTPALEYRIKRNRGEWIPVAVPAGEESVTVEGLAPGTYEFRRPGDENHFASSPETITIQPGPKLTVTLPDKQEGYSLTASKTQLGWHENVVLTFQLDSVGVYKAADFGIWAEAGSEKTKLTLGNDGAIKLTAPEKDITITVTGVKTDDVAPKVYIQGRMSQDSFDYVKWEGFQENPADDFVNGNFVISATDRLSGVASLWYCLSQTPLTRADMDTASWKQAGKVSITEDGVYYLYAKALDNANNAGYACTGKLVKESNPPTFSGVENGKTYYVSQQMEIHDDGMPDWYMAEGSIGVVPNGGNENPIKLRLPNNGSSYTFTVGDRCGNEASITVYMKPLSDLTQPLDRIQEETIRKSDRATLDDVEATLKGLDVTYATEPEKKEMNDALARIAQLRQVLDQVAAVEAQIDALPDSVEPYQQTVEDTQIKPARQAYSDLTDHQKTLVDSTKLDKLVRLEAQLDAWTITEGDGQTWYKGSGKSLSFTVNGQKRKFDGIRQGNTYIGSGVSSLLTASGEMDKPFTLTLKPEFLQCQTPGEHSFTVVYYSGLYSSGYLSISVTYTVETPANYLDVTDREEFEGKTTVTVDGKEYPIEEMAGYLQRIPTQRYVNLPETGDLLTIYSFKDGTPTGSYTNYPMGMQVFRITRQEGGAKAEEITEFANLLNYAGCSIRISGKQGIRMITGIDQNVKKSLVSKAGLAGYTLEEYGTVVQWADTLGSNTLNLSSSNKKNYAYKKGKADPIFAKADGMIQYTNVLVGFTDAQCQPDLVMRPYIKLTDTATGETVTLYGGSVTRSIGYVAWQNRDTYKPGTASYKYVWNIINSVDTSKYPN